ncbi:unnamed protein product [Moneuplotes crassus]|uniref:Protein BFR2 n=2 Tax=Euplotes crassus TaxID=5936 RepID=A0AAD1UE18_EUPCR|nr:unnamed protein product [Moneuplotes crassus]
MSESDSSEYEGLPEDYDITQGNMIKMAKQFKENQQEEELAGELDSLVYRSKKVTSQDLSKNEKLRGNVQEESDDGFEVVEESSDGEKDPKEASKEQESDDQESYDQEEENSAQGYGKNYDNQESDEDAAMIDKLEKLEKQDNNYKGKVMLQNKEDLQKASQVKEQRKVQEAIVSQRMIIQKILTKTNQFPQSDVFKQFEEDKAEELNTLKSNLKKNICTLNEISMMLGKRMNVNLSPISTDDEDILPKVDKNYERLLPTCEELVQKWHSRTQVNTNVLNQKLAKRNVSLSALQQPILTQVYKTLENKQFIETRTHQKRDVYRVLGKPVESLEEKLDFQIYDDKDFYQSLMRDLLNSSSGSIEPEKLADDHNISMSLTQEYLRKRDKMRKLMSKKTKKSNKISKDKKLKYIIHDKLINFMAPYDTEVLHNGREDILKILFGCTVEEGEKEEEELDIGII